MLRFMCAPVLETPDHGAHLFCITKTWTNDDVTSDCKCLQLNVLGGGGGPPDTACPLQVKDASGQAEGMAKQAADQGAGAAKGAIGDAHGAAKHAAGQVLLRTVLS